MPGGFSGCVPGDGIYLTDGEGTHVMIDGGSSDEKQVGKYRIEPFLKYHRVQSVDVWIISHADEDHCSGALELMQAGYPVRYLLLAEAAPEDDSVRALELAAGQNGTEVVRVQAGDSLQLAGCRMECLYPAADEEGGEKKCPLTGLGVQTSGAVCPFYRRYRRGSRGDAV